MYNTKCKANKIRNERQTKYLGERSWKETSSVNKQGNSKIGKNMNEILSKKKKDFFSPYPVYNWISTCL